MIAFRVVAILAVAAGPVCASGMKSIAFGAVTAGVGYEIRGDTLTLSKSQPDLCAGVSGPWALPWVGGGLRRNGGSRSRRRCRDPVHLCYDSAAQTCDANSHEHLVR